MADTAAYGSIRVQTYRLAWLSTFSMLAVVVLMWVMGHGANEVLAEVGIGLFFGASLFSMLARRFAPLGWALVGFLLLGASLCA